MEQASDASVLRKAGEQGTDGVDTPADEQTSRKQRLIMQLRDVEGKAIKK